MHPESAPILILAFNRVEPLHQLLQALKSSRPRQLFVAADGPRNGHTHPQDSARCEAVRRLLSDPPWPCEVQTRFLERNEGCGRAVSGAIGWFFDHVPAGIILEDDCIPAPGFIPFATRSLRAFAGDDRVMSVLGSRCAPSARPGAPSHTLSRFFNVWGWASWKRAWSHYRFDISWWQTAANDPQRVLPGLESRSAHYWSRRFLHVARQRHPTTWDHQWTLAHFLRDARCVLPPVNLINNVGDGVDATHVARPSPWCNRPLGASLDSFVEPQHAADDPDADAHYETWVNNHRPWLLRKAWQLANRWQIGSARFRRGGID